MLWTLIPAKSFHLSKRRLAGVLDEGQRAALSAALLAHTVRVARAAFGSQPVIVVAGGDDIGATAREAGADEAILAVADGLNPQLAEVAARVPEEAALLVLHADLPLLEREDLIALAAETASVTLAPDHWGEGTNALLQRIPDRFFAFGQGSRAQHEHAAAIRGLSTTLVKRAGLARDLDDADDWAALERRLCVSGERLALDDLLERLAQPV